MYLACCRERESQTERPAISASAVPESLRCGAPRWFDIYYIILYYIILYYIILYYIIIIGAEARVLEVRRPPLV